MHLGAPSEKRQGEESHLTGMAKIFSGATSLQPLSSSSSPAELKGKPKEPETPRVSPGESHILYEEPKSLHFTRPVENEDIPTLPNLATL